MGGCLKMKSYSEATRMHIDHPTRLSQCGASLSMYNSMHALINVRIIKNHSMSRTSELLTMHFRCIAIAVSI